MADAVRHVRTAAVSAHLRAAHLVQHRAAAPQAAAGQRPTTAAQNSGTVGAKKCSWVQLVQQSAHTV